MLRWYIAMHDATMAINDVTMLCFNTCRMLPRWRYNDVAMVYRNA